MIIITDTRNFLIEEPTVVTIGKFDGDHIGHQKIFSYMRELKDKCGYRMTAFTFNTAQIISAEKKHQRLKEEGLDYLIEYPFIPEVLAIEGDVFLRDILIQKLHMKAIVAGPDCTFGHNKSGNVEMLRANAAQLGYEVHIIEKIRDRDGYDINSTKIREMLADGRVNDAREYLGDSAKYL